MKAPRLSLLARLRTSRQASLLSFAVALGALLFAAVWFTSARARLDEAYGLVGDRQQALAAAERRMQEAQLRVKLATGAAELVQAASSGGFVDSRWGERLINIAQSPLTRNEVNDLLSNVTRNQSRIFGAQEFELSVTRAEEGLFDPPGPRSPPLMLTLRGTLMFRTGSADLPPAAGAAAIPTPQPPLAAAAPLALESAP